MEAEFTSQDASQAEELAKSPLEVTTVDFEHPDLLVGQLLDGRFLIEKNLLDAGADTGGIGVVYLATDSKLMGRRLVIKILRKELQEFDDVVRKFQHEKEALIRLDHPGIVRIIDSGNLSDGSPFIAMDYIEGFSLRKAMGRQTVLPLHVVAHIVESFTDALAAAHSKKVLHRDIKPENIMLTPVEGSYDRVSLIDFGIARVEESLLAPETEVSRAIGTVLYIAPEQLIGQLDLKPAADIFSAAIVIYELLTGGVPFKPKTIAEMYRLESEGVKVPPSRFRQDLSPEAERLLLSALEFDADKRPQNIRIFGQDLARALRGPSLLDERPASVEDDEFLTSIKTEVYPTLAVDPVATAAPTQPRDSSEPVVKRRMPLIIALVVLGMGILAAGTYTALYADFGKANQQPPTESPAKGTAVDAGPPIGLAYFLTVQKMRDGVPYQEPFRASGREIFENGYLFTMNFQLDQTGYFYLFNEGKGSDGAIEFRVLYPTPDNNLDPKVTAGQVVQPPQNKFEGGRGTEIVWVVWTRKERDEPKNAIDSVDRYGIIPEPASSELVNFFEAHRNDPRSFDKDSVNQRTVIKANGDLLLHRFELEHR